MAFYVRINQEILRGLERSAVLLYKKRPNLVRPGLVAHMVPIFYDVFDEQNSNVHKTEVRLTFHCKSGINREIH